MYCRRSGALETANALAGDRQMTRFSDQRAMDVQMPGMDDYVTKPTRVDAVEALLRVMQRSGVAK